MVSSTRITHPVNGINEEICTSFACRHPELLTDLVFVLSTLVAGVFLAAAIVILREALSTVSEEHRRASSERDAFKRFAGQVGEIAPETPGTQQIASGPTMHAGSTTGSSATSRMTAVRDAYRETVMAVPHYDEEYDEPLSTNLSMEFGSELAAAVCGDGPFTPQVKQSLRQRAMNASEEREAFLQALSQESCALDEAHDRFGSSLDRADRIADHDWHLLSYEEVTDDWDALESLEDDVDEVLSDRQESLRRPAGRFRRGDRHEFCRYLYQSLDVDYPILSAGTDVVERIRSVKRDVTHALARRT